MPTKRTWKFALCPILGLVLASTLIVGCSTPPEIDRTKRGVHTAMRGPAYKTLVLTYNEANNLAYRTDRYAKALRDAGTVDADTQLQAQELAEDVAKFADDVEWSLANNQRIGWHKSIMNEFWDRFLDLYPEDEAYRDAYASKEMRKVTRKIDLKNQAEYADVHTYERHNPNWPPLFKTTGRAIYDRQIEKQD
tara:strand:- start:1962 stop:2540 length:579 start_codon:yes stop_codon:yes gene_type:complete